MSKRKNKFVCPHQDCAQIIKKPRISLPANSTLANIVCPCPKCEQDILWVRMAGDAELIRAVPLDSRFMVTGSLMQKLMYLATMAVSKLCDKDVVWSTEDDYEYCEGDDEGPLDSEQEGSPGADFAEEDTVSEGSGQITDQEQEDFTTAMDKWDKAPSDEDINGT